MPTMWWKKPPLEVKNRRGLLINIYFSFSSPVISYFPLLSFQPLQQAIGGYAIGSYVGSEVENAAAKLQHKLSPVKDVTKRPFLSGGPRCEDELDTEALYTFNSLHAWYDFCPCVAGILLWDILVFVYKISRMMVINIIAVNSDARRICDHSGELYLDNKVSHHYPLLAGNVVKINCCGLSMKLSNRLKLKAPHWCWQIWNWYGWIGFHSFTNKYADWK